MNLFALTRWMRCGLLGLILLWAQAPANAELAFPGGSCVLLDSQGNGVRLDYCQNMSGVTVNDIHLTLSHPGLPTVTLNYGQSIACATSGLGDCFGPAVEPADRWEGILGNKGPASNVTIWGADALSGVTDFSMDKVKLSGYWTKDGVPVVVVPEAASLTMLMAGLGVLHMLGMRYRVRHCRSA